jgi:hypothetical protein
MNFNSLSIVEFGDRDSLGEMLFENGLQHQLFRDTLFRKGVPVPAYPLFDADPDNLDDWLLAHQVEHQLFARVLNLGNPFNLLDVNWNKEDQFYDWISNHLTIHQQIAAGLGLNA